MKETTPDMARRSRRLGIAFALCATFSTAARADIAIGVVLSLTGPGASLGIPENDTIKLWPQTMGGEKVVVTVLNDNSDPTTAAIAARKLITENKVDLLIGSSVTPPSIAMVEVAGENKVALLSLAGGSAIVEPQEGNRKWAFKFSPTETFADEVLLAHAQKNGVRSVGVIGLSNAYGDGFVRNFERLAAAKGIQIVASERYATTDTSVVGQVVKLLAAKPDAIFIAASGTPGALPQIELAQRGWKGPVYQTQGVANNDYLRVGGKAVEGTFMSTAPVLVAEQLADSDPLKKPGVEYVTRFEAAYGPNTRTLFGSTAWDVFFMVRQVVATAITTTKPGTPEFRAAIRDGMENLKGFVSSEGFFNMSEKDHNGVDASCQVLVRVENGRWKLVAP
jgi:branched-chain amino acid transport system substrate-binding protein